MMCLGLNKLTIRKLDNVELREITETTRSKLNSRIQTRVRSNSKQQQNMKNNRK
jgi:methyl coenzyme M reductase subunit C-like uncharacterized protein (methanogenesis marker protein 7)